MINLKGAVYVGPNEPLEVRDLTISDQPGRGEVLVKLAASGVCHSDLHVIDGDWDVAPPIVMGHEGAGVVVSVGEGVHDLDVGDHVILSWLPSCGRCEFCAAGRSSLCTTAVATAYENVAADGKPRLNSEQGEVKSYLGVGSFGEYAMVQESAAIKIRQDAPLAQASLVGCAVTTGIGAVINTARVEPGSTVLVVGLGGVGVNVVQGARLAGARQIIVADVHDSKRELAEHFGATEFINSREVDLVERVMELTSGRGVDYAFEAIGLTRTIEQCYESICRGGTAVVVGQTPEGSTISIDPFVMSDSEKRIIGSNYGSSRQSIDFPRLLDLYMEGKVDLDSLITRRISLDEINDAFDDMRQGSGLRAVIEY